LRCQSQVCCCCHRSCRWRNISCPSYSQCKCSRWCVLKMEVTAAYCMKSLQYIRSTIIHLVCSSELLMFPVFTLPVQISSFSLSGWRLHITLVCCLLTWKYTFCSY
jgi:hypothetical protein